MVNKIGDKKCCSKCREIQPIDQFTRHKNNPDGLSFWCRGCQLGYRLATRERQREQVRVYRKDNPDKVKESRDKWRRQLKLRVLTHYAKGVPHCVGCGITDIDVLCLDHIANNGAAQRRELKLWGQTFYSWVESQNYPSDFQVLCFNCNTKKKLGHNLLSRKDLVDGIVEEIKKELLTYGEIIVVVDNWAETATNDQIYQISKGHWELIAPVIAQAQLQKILKALEEK